MSTFAIEHVACPACAHETARQVATSLNASRAQKPFDAILEGSFQRFTCPSCGHVHVVESPCILINLPQDWVICTYPPAWETTWGRCEALAREVYDANLGDKAPRLAQLIADGVRLRVTFGLAAVREKMVCFGAGLDDAWVELLKLHLLRDTPQLTPDPRLRLRLVEADDAELTFLTPDGRALTYPRDIFDSLTTHPDAHAAVMGRLTAGPYVDLGRVLIDPDPELRDDA